MDGHISNLNQLCLVCGGRVQKAKATDNYKPKICFQYAEQIKDKFKIDVSGDNERCHPNSICILLLQPKVTKNT